MSTLCVTTLCEHSMCDHSMWDLSAILCMETNPNQPLLACLVSFVLLPFVSHSCWVGLGAFAAVCNLWILVVDFSLVSFCYACIAYLSLPGRGW